MRHQVDDRDLLPRRVGLGRLYLYLFEVRDLLQLEGMRRAGERYDAAQHLVSERALCEHALRMQLAPRLAAVRWCSTAYRAVTSPHSRAEAAAVQLGLSHTLLLTLLLPIFAWSLLEESCNTIRVYIWSS